MFIYEDRGDISPIPLVAAPLLIIQLVYNNLNYYTFNNYNSLIIIVIYRILSSEVIK